MACSLQVAHGVDGNANVAVHDESVASVQSTSVALGFTVPCLPVSPHGSAMSTRTCLVKSARSAPAASNAMRVRPEWPTVSIHVTVIVSPGAYVVTCELRLPSDV